MHIGRNTRLFFDASVLVAGAYSREGGSALLLEACRWGGFRPLITVAVLGETLHALRAFPVHASQRFQQLLTEVRWEVVPVPQKRTLEKYQQYVEAKDVHVLAAAVEGRAEFLLTLDRRHILSAAKAIDTAGLGIIVLRPGDFIRDCYGQHESYAELPPARGGSRAE
jgi:predicted nucleic acid-binding protein